MAKKYFIIQTLIILLILLVTNYAYAERRGLSNKEYYFKFNIQSKEEIDLITRIVSIDNVMGNEVYAYANSKQLKQIKALGYSVNIIPKLGADIKDLTMAYTIAEMANWDRYPTYDVYIDMMNQFATNYPSICKLENIGSSVEGRDILFVKISDNVNIEENEPEFMYTAQMHGDEIVTYIMMLRLIDYILSNYNTDDEMTHLVNNAEIWINPLANPDGTYAGGNNTVSGATRYNANWVDLNRNFPDPEDGPHPDGNPWQPETIVMMDLAEENTFVHSANFHSGAEVVNYPWDTWNIIPADDDWYIDISKAYADTVFANSPSGYFTSISPTGYIRGYLWYSINGGRQDYMNYFQGCKEVTIELSNTFFLPASQLPVHWNYNKRSFINYMKNIFYGIRGLVTDNLGNPLSAKITVVGYDYDSSHVYTDPDIGDYHRMLLPGTYDLKFSAWGYLPEIVYNINVIDTGATVVNVVLDSAFTISVTGVVTDYDTHSPIQGAVVSVLDAPVEPDTTDFLGGYSIPSIVEGTYTFRVCAEGYSTLTEEINVTADSNVVNFELISPYIIWNFEFNDGNFTSNNINGWQWGEPSAGNISPYSGDKLWGTVLDRYYANSANWTLESPEFCVPSQGYLKFYHYYDFEAGTSLWDGGNVEISTDSGSTFTLITPDDGYDGYIFALGAQGFAGSSNEWIESTFDLDGYGDQNVILRWRFASDTSVHDYFGWYIDDVSINEEFGIEDEHDHYDKIVLAQNYPNPFNPNKENVEILFKLPQHTILPRLFIYNIKGQLVQKLKLTQKGYQDNKIIWNGEDKNGNVLANGVYFYRIISKNDQSKVKKLLLIR